MRPAHPGYQRGSINRADISLTPAIIRFPGPGHPAPGAFDVNPAAIMEGRKAPRLIVHPGVSPRSDIGPVAVVIGSPASFCRVGIPHIAVFSRGSPATILIKILVAD